MNKDYKFEMTRIAVDFDIENDGPEYGMFHSFHHFYADGRERLVRVMWDDRWDFYEKGEPMPFVRADRALHRTSAPETIDERYGFGLCQGAGLGFAGSGILDFGSGCVVSIL